MPEVKEIAQREAWLEVLVSGQIGNLRFRDTNRPPVGIVILVDGREKYILKAKDGELELEWYW